jgi:hypothetical protein
MNSRPTCKYCGENPISHFTGSSTAKATGYCSSCYFSIDANDAAPHWFRSVVDGVSRAIDASDFSKCVREADCKRQLRVRSTASVDSVRRVRSTCRTRLFRS